MIPQFLVSIYKNSVRFARLARRQWKITIVVFILTLNVVITSLLAYGYFFGLDRFYFIRFLPRVITHTAFNVVLGVKKISVDMANLPYQFYGLKTSALPLYELNLKPKDLRQLNANLPAADFNGVLGEQYKDAQPAVLAVNGKNYDIKARYRGDLPIHWRGEKKSWRINLQNGHTFEGMTSLNLMVPASRDFVMEYFNNYRAKKLGLAVPNN